MPTDGLRVTGDLNDTPQAATTQLLLGPPGSEIGTPGFDQPDDGDGQRLWNLVVHSQRGAGPDCDGHVGEHQRAVGAVLGRRPDVSLRATLGSYSSTA